MNGLEGKDILTAGVIGICKGLRVPDLLDKSIPLGTRAGLFFPVQSLVFHAIYLYMSNEGIFTSLKKHFPTPQPSRLLREKLHLSCKG